MARKKKEVAPPMDKPAGVPKDSWEPKKYEPTEEDKERDGGYDLDHLIRAEEIKQDPEKMKYVVRAREKKLSAITSIKDLHHASEMLAKQETEKKKKA